MMEKTIQIEAYYMQHFAGFLKKMKETEDVDGRPLLDNVMMLYGAAIADGGATTTPICRPTWWVAGPAKWKAGRYVEIGRSLPMSNLFVTMLDKMGVEVDSFGDSNGRFDYI